MFQCLAVDALGDVFDHDRLRRLPETRKSSTDRIVQGTWSAQPDSDADASGKAPRVSRRLGRESRAGGALSRFAAWPGGGDLHAAGNTSEQSYGQAPLWGGVVPYGANFEARTSRVAAAITEGYRSAPRHFACRAEEASSWSIPSKRAGTGGCGASDARLRSCFARRRPKRHRD
jgi:hypothetical protein